MCTLKIYYAVFAAADIEPLDTIIRKTKRECTAVARAHYKGTYYEWKWA